jgi:hypothetical protein
MMAGCSIEQFLSIWLFGVDFKIDGVSLMVCVLEI